MTDCKFVKKISKPVCKLTYFKTLGHIYVQLHNIRYTIDKNIKIFSTGPVGKKKGPTLGNCPNTKHKNRHDN